MDDHTGWSPPPIAGESSLQSSSGAISPPDAKCARVSEDRPALTGTGVPAMAALTAGMQCPNTGTASAKVVPISWMAQHDVSLSSAENQTSGDVSIASAELEVAQAQAQAAEAKARAAEARLQWVRAQNTLDPGARSASAVSGSQPSVGLDLTQELSRIVSEEENESPSTQYYVLYGGSEEDDGDSEMLDKTIDAPSVPEPAAVVPHGTLNVDGKTVESTASGSRDVPQHLVSTVPTAAETIRYPPTSQVPTHTIPGNASVAHVPILPTVSSDEAPAGTLAALKHLAQQTIVGESRACQQMAQRSVEEIRQAYEDEARNIVAQTISRERYQIEDAARKAVNYAREQAEAIVANERQRVAVAENQVVASLRTEAHDAVARERQHMSQVADQAVTVVRADAENVIASERARMDEWAAQNNQLAAAMKSKDDQIVVQRFMQERDRLEAAARVAEEARIHKVEENAAARLRDLEHIAHEHLTALQRSSQAKDEELKERQEASHKAAQMLEQEAEARMLELQHGLRMQASAEAAEAWASYKLDFKAANDRELAATERQSEVEAVLAGYRQQTTDLQERNKQLALNVEQLTDALRRVPVPNSPDTAGGGFGVPVVMAAGTQTVTIANGVSKTSADPGQPPNKDNGPPSGDPNGNPNPGGPAGSGNPPGNGDKGGEKREPQRKRP